MLAVVLAAIGWRLVLLVQMPCVSPDGAKYCMLAQHLAAHGLAALRTPEFDQHPLFPMTIAGVQSVLVALGQPPDPMTWQRAGQAITMTCGLATLLLTGLLAGRVAIGLSLPVRVDHVRLWALVLAGLLPLNDWLAVDVMSEHLMLTFYLTACCLLINSSPTALALPACVAVGALAGLAFLVRPEGAVPLAGAATLIFAIHRLSAGRRAVMLATVLAAFVPFVLLFTFASGRLSPKLDKQGVDEFVAAAFNLPSYSAETPLEDGLVQAAIDRRRSAWWQAAPIALYETARGGRVAIVLLALVGFFAAGRKWLSPPVIAVTACGAIHFTLTCILQWHAGYLSPRHTLVVIVVLLIPAAAWTLAALLGAAHNRLWRAIGGLAAAATIFTLAFYSLRVPQKDDLHIREVAAWISAQPGTRPTDIVLGGSSLRRIAFYAGVAFRPWAENIPDDAARDEHLVDHLRNWHPAPRWLIIEYGPGFQRRRDDAMVSRLLSDPRLRGRLMEAPGASVRTARTVRAKVIEIGPPFTSSQSYYNPSTRPAAATSQELNP